MQTSAPPETRARRSFLASLILFKLKAFRALVALIVTLWGCAALWIDGPETRWAAMVLSVGFGVGAVALLFLLRRTWHRWVAWAALIALVMTWWFLIPPSNDRPWRQEVAHLPSARIEGDLVTISNVRNFHYRTEDDFDEHWEERTYDLSQLVGVDMYLIYWGSPNIAHTIVSWDFANSDPLTVSIEVRKEVGEGYSSIAGFFRQYELYYAVATERDVIGLRTGVRGEEVYLYRLAAPVDQARAVLLDYLHEVNELAEHPLWYNALTHNCTTMIRSHVQNVTPGRPWNWRILANGHLDRLGYMRGSINTSLPFEELRRQSHINERAQQVKDGESFSAAIREGLPARPEPPEWMQPPR